jgi:hypothetical protein
MTWRIWSPVGSTSCSNASFETSFSPAAASALREAQVRRRVHARAAGSLGAGGVDHSFADETGVVVSTPNPQRFSL